MERDNKSPATISGFSQFLGAALALQSFTHSRSPSDSPTEGRYRIRNLVTGEEIDLRDENKPDFSSKIVQMTAARTNVKPTQIHYSEKRKMNERLWEAARLNRAAETLDLLKFETYGDLTAQVNAKGLNDWTALHIAASEGSIDVARALVQRAEETDLEAITALCQTALHLAAAKGFLDIMQILVSGGANVNAQDYMGCTPLHIIAKNNRIEAGAWLLTRGPDIAIKSEAGKTAYEESASGDMAEVFETYFAEKGICFQKIAIERSKEQRGRSTGKGARQVPALHQFIHMLKKPISSLIEQSSRLKNPNPAETHTADATVSPADFEIKARIGKGAFGEVFLVVKKPSGEIYAMKVLDKAMIRKENLVKYAVTERNVLSYISHPFIMGLHYAFQTPEKLILVIDYCPGGDLGTVIAREKRLPEEVARIYICEMILAIEELHNHDILYRDLKPQNILLDYQGHAILTDFGLSKENVPDDEVAESFLGSQFYLAPEILAQAGHHKSVDWYTLGTVLYELLTGRPPFYALKEKELYKNIQAGKLKVPKQVSPAARDLIERLLNRNPKERLGAGARGALDLKEHPFFEGEVLIEGVDWAAVLRRQLRPPVPIRNFKRHDELIDPESVFGDLEAYDPDTTFEGWAFTSPNRG